jgi:hypothetical protein
MKGNSSKQTNQPNKGVPVRIPSNITPQVSNGPASRPIDARHIPR